MPIVGLGIHFLIALYFAVHAVRTGRESYWLFVLFSFPLLGSIVYFFAIFMPDSRLERTLRKAGDHLGKRLDPGRALREAQQAFDLTPTAHNQLQLARALYDANMIAQAVAQFDACLRGPFAGDPEIGTGAALARLAHGDAPGAIALLERLATDHQTFRPEQVGVLLAKAYASAGRQADAAEQFERVVSRFTTIEARAECALWALAQGQRGVAQREIKELDHARKHMTNYARDLHRDLFRRLDAERARLAA
jgi:hypothetical protein